jgi:hypothetical protein
MSLDVLWELTVVETVKLLNRLEATDKNKRNEITSKRCSNLRYLLEPYIYNYLLIKYGSKLEENWKNYMPPKKSSWAYCIVERRPHPNFWYILRAMAWAGPQMSVYIFCSDENEGFIHSLLGEKADNMNIIPYFRGNPDMKTAIQDYNNFYTDYRNYMKIDAEYILTLQMDNIIRKKLDMRMFTTDYYGSPWSWDQDEPGGGGATVRRVEKMVEICRMHRPDPDNTQCEIAEDGWISQKIKKSGIFPSIEFRGKILMESLLTEDPFIIHQTWTFMDGLIIEGKQNFLEICYGIIKMEI